MAFENSAWFARLDGRAHLIARTVLQRDGIEARRLAVESLDEVFTIDPNTLSRRFSTHAPLLAAQAGQRAMIQAGLQPSQVDAVVVSTCTGYLCPGLSGHVVERLGLRADVHRAALTPGDVGNWVAGGRDVLQALEKRRAAGGAVTMPRIVAKETLDHLAPEDPAARRSRRDLVGVHRAMGTRSIVSRGLRGLLPPESVRVPLRILEIGAGDGSVLLGIARSLAPRWPPVQLTLMDRQDIISPTTLAGYAELGWSAQVRVADVLTWAAQPDDAAPGLLLPRWDLITTTLVLHHFESGQLDLLLAAVASRTDRFFACEPK